MFEIWETTPPARRLGEAGTFDAAVEELDAECGRRHAQAAANGEGASQMRFRFEIREAGEIAAMLSWGPDLTRPYESVGAAMRGFGEAF
ncbi:hypothetical protein ACFHW2_11980 [Actinomadura sp. LOL_016]|uniref:hypothetical protein n=1 Tax=unclassified Actinomadura TaxID=2626254 RepID=UPI003A80F030